MSIPLRGILANPMVRCLAVAAVGAGVAALVYLTGGTKLVYGHAGHVPVLLAAAAFAPWGGLVMAFLMMLALGPFMPLDVAAQIPQQPTNWLLRGVFLMLTGGTAGWLIHRVAGLGRAVERALLVDDVTGAVRAAAQAAREEQGGKPDSTHHWGIAVAFGIYEQVVRAWGVEAGNALLRSSAELLHRLAPDAAISRMYSDHFFVLAPGDSGPTGARIAQALSQEAVTLQAGDVAVRAEIRIGFVPPQAEPMTTAMIHHATLQALHDAQRTRKTLHEYQRNDVEAESQHNLWLVLAAQRALGERQFELHYQPKIGLADGRATGCEALIRWRHPEHGLILPGDFLPVVEQTSLMWPLTQWVIGTATAQLSAWRKDGLDIGMAVNLSAHDLAEPSLAAFISRELRTQALPADRLTFELTETAMYDDVNQAAAGMAGLHGLGVKLALDDFGTGYSSLASLHAFRFDQIKIDRQFVANLTTDPKANQIARAVSALGRELDYVVVAEGVEDDLAARRLHDMGCTEAQGYYYGKPMTVTDFAAWMRKRAA